MHQRVIHIQPEAPRKPAVGEPCNGCGVCCLAEPCPVGVLVSRRRHGACQAVVWVPARGRYVCGLLAAEAEPPPAHWWHRLARRWWLRWARRMIAAGQGCDADFETEPLNRP